MSDDLLRLIDDLIPNAATSGAPGATIETVQVLDGPDSDGLYTVDFAGAELDRVPSISTLTTIEVPVRALATAGGLLILGSPSTGGGSSLFTPDLRGETTDPFIGAGTTSAFWTKDGRWIDYEFEIVLGTGFTAGTGDWSVTVPAVPDAPDGTPVGFVHLVDSTDPTAAANRRVWALTTRTGEDSLNMRGTGDTSSRWVAPTIPFTWAVGDTLRGQARYRSGVLVPQQAPTLANVLTAQDTVATATHVIDLVAGTADKIIVLIWFDTGVASTQVVVPDGWEIAGPTSWLDGGYLALLYRQATDDTQVTVTTTTPTFPTALFAWTTAHVIDGDLGRLQWGNCVLSCGSGHVITPGALSGELTSWLGVGIGVQWGSSITNTPPSTWPANLPNDQVFRWRNAGINDIRFAIASGPFIATNTITFDPFTWPDEGVETRKWMSFAIPRALV